MRVMSMPALSRRVAQAVRIQIFDPNSSADLGNMFAQPRCRNRLASLLQPQGVVLLPLAALGRQVDVNGLASAIGEIDQSVTLSFALTNHQSFAGQVEILKTQVHTFSRPQAAMQQNQ